jgi:hypothetical protein
VAFIAVACLLGPIRDLLKALADRLKSGAGVKIAGAVELAADATVVKRTDDLKLGGVKKEGNPDQLVLLFKVQQNAMDDSVGKLWMKSTKALQVGAGCFVQVSTERRNPDGTWAIAEAVTWIPNVKIGEDQSGHPMLVERTAEPRGSKSTGQNP